MRHLSPLVGLLVLVGLTGCATPRPMIEGYQAVPVVKPPAPEYQRKLWAVTHWQEGAINVARTLGVTQGPLFVAFNSEVKIPSPFLVAYRAFLQNELLSKGVVLSEDPSCPNVLRITAHTIWHRGHFDQNHLLDTDQVWFANATNVFVNMGYTIENFFQGDYTGTAASTSGEMYVINELLVNGTITKGQVEIMYIPHPDKGLYDEPEPVVLRSVQQP